MRWLIRRSVLPMLQRSTTSIVINLCRICTHRSVGIRRTAKYSAAAVVAIAPSSQPGSHLSIATRAAAQAITRIAVSLATSGSVRQMRAAAVEVQVARPAAPSRIAAPWWRQLDVTAVRPRSTALTRIVDMSRPLEIIHPCGRPTASIVAANRTRAAVQSHR